MLSLASERVLLHHLTCKDIREPWVSVNLQAAGPPVLQQCFSMAGSFVFSRQTSSVSKNGSKIGHETAERDILIMPKL